MSETSEADVVRFLKNYKRAGENSLYVIPRERNEQDLSVLGLTTPLRREIILGLQSSNYLSGPTPDHDRDGEVWCFGESVEGREVYIKLKLDRRHHRNIAKCISFHVAERTLLYPFRQAVPEEREN